jgi:hypothetical protein
MTKADRVHSTPPPNTSSINPTAGLDWLDVRADASPADIFRAIGKLRKDARDEIDRLIRFLDETDNPMELEPEDEGDDAELEDDDPAEDDGLREPSLGSVGDVHFDQRRWAAGDRRDLELDDGEAGIGDYDGLAEQVGSQDWQQAGMG